MKLFEGCLLASDVDGTLMVNGEIAPRTVERIRFFIEQGGFFSIATGRSVGAISSVLKKIPDIAPSIVANGGMIYDYANEQILFECSLNDSDKSFVQKVYERFPEVGIEIHHGADVFVLHPNVETNDHEEYEGLTSMIVTPQEILNLTWNKVLFAPLDVASMQNLCDLSVGTSQTCRYFQTTAPVYQRDRFYLEQMPNGVDKGPALCRLRELIGVRPGCCYAIGDYYNDLSMLKEADISAVTVDSPDDLKAQANFVTGSVRSGAVADFIDYLTTLKN